MGENAEKEEAFFFGKRNSEVLVPGTKLYSPLFQAILSLISVSFACSKITSSSQFQLTQLFS